MTYKTILVDREDAVARIRLNRPDALNALNSELAGELLEALAEIDADPAIRCTILTGEGRAFAAGADIREMSDKSFAEMNALDFFGQWDAFAKRRKPIIAAVNGFALGGGCELAMMCDFIIASEAAKFGQPEIKLGVIPGMGGSQRMTRAIGKSKTMDLCLTGRMMDAKEAEAAGLVARVVPADKLMEEATAAAKTIASYSLPALIACKEAVNRAFEATLAEGVLFERRTFHALFATEDQKEGMAAFLAKRPANFTHR